VAQGVEVPPQSQQLRSCTARSCSIGRVMACMCSAEALCADPERAGGLWLWLHSNNQQQA
jgi:hypothetical protein